MSNTDSQRLDAMRRQRDGYRNQLRKTEQQVQRVREVHRPVSDPFGVSCAACIGDSRRSPYPCDTIRALDGEPNE